MQSGCDVSFVDEAEELFGPHVPTANRCVFAESYIRVYSANLFPSNILNTDSWFTKHKKYLKWALHFKRIKGHFPNLNFPKISNASTSLGFLENPKIGNQNVTLNVDLQVYFRTSLLPRDPVSPVWRQSAASWKTVYTFNLKIHRPLLSFLSLLSHDHQQ